VKKLIPAIAVITTNAAILLLIFKLATGEFVPNVKFFAISLVMLVVNCWGIGRVLFK
jgi:hypothetical protein